MRIRLSPFYHRQITVFGGVSRINQPRKQVSSKFAMRGCSSLAGSGLLLLVLSMWSVAFAPPASAASPGPVKQPRAGATGLAAPVRTVVAASSRRTRVFKARLNGRDVTASFGHPRRGRRTARLSPSHGLRYGRNVLRVRLRLKGQARVKVRTVRFSVSTRRPMAAAGLDRRVVKRRQTVRLSARRSRARPAARREGRRRGRKRPHRPRTGRWRLVRKPRASQLRRAAVRRTVRLGGHRVRGPRFRPDAIGRYVFMLIVNDGVRSRPDRVAVEVVEGTPLVSVDTAEPVEPSGEPGEIIVGGNLYRWDGKGPLQVVVLQRRTLELASNTSYAGGADGMAAFERDMNALDDSKLVIATTWASTGGGGDAYNAGIARIGGLPFSAALLSTEIQRSVIGIPGLPRGGGWQNVGNTSSRVGAGGLQGWFTPDPNNNYRFVSDGPFGFGPFVSFDMGVGGSVSDIDIGPEGGSQAVLPPGASGGVHLVFVDRQRPGIDFADTFVTNQANWEDGFNEIARLVERLNSLPTAVASDLIFLRSLGTPFTSPGHTEYDAGLEALGSAIEQIGATRDTVTERPTGFAIIGWHGWAYGTGWDGAGPGGALEVSSRMPGVTSTRLQGRLSLTNRQLYEPDVSAIADSLGYPLLDVAYGPGADWPGDGPGWDAALKYISNEAGLGDDPRLAYWQHYATIGSGWGSISNKINALAYPGDGQGFSEQDFEAVRSQLFNETGWVANVYRYLSALSQPAAQDGLSSFAQVQTIANQINTTLNANAADETNAEATSIISEVFYLGADLFEPAASALAGMAGAFALAGDLSANEDGSSVVDVSARADQLGLELVDSLRSLQDGITALGRIIVSDYGKLQTVGTQAGCPTDPCSPEWQLTDQQQYDASDVLLINSKRTLWSSLIPAAVTIFELVGSGDYAEQPRISSANEYRCDTGGGKTDLSSYPFQDARPGGQAYRGQTSDGHSVFWALGQRDEKFNAEPPPASLIDPLFAPVDQGGNPTKGGLALWSPKVFIQHWRNTTPFTAC